MPRTKQPSRIRRTPIQRKKNTRLKLLNKTAFTRKRVLAVAAAFAIIGAIIISQSRAGVMEDYTFAGRATKNLDASGKVIPKTNYPVPAGAVYMSPAGTDKKSSSPDGNDTTGDGTINKPYRTINKAISAVPAGGTIVMRGGEYRDWHSNGSMVIFQEKNFTLQAAAGESPWFNGADVVKANWQSDGQGRWFQKWETPTFCGGQYYTPVEGGKTPFAPNLTASTPCVYWDSVRGSKNVAGDPQMAFVNGTKLAQVPSLAQVTSNTFYYDWATRNMYIGTDPAASTVELTKRPNALMLSKGSYAIKGIGFKNYGSSIYPEGSTWYSGSVVLINDPVSATIENSVFSFNAGTTVNFAKPKNSSILRNNVIANNGGAGLGSNGSAKSTGRNDFMIDGNIFNANNQDQFDLQCGPSCGAGSNIKLANMVGFTAKNNIIENGVGPATPGIWCDINCTDGKIINNIVRNNGNRGIFYEISSKGIIASNLVLNNGTYGISVYSASTKVYNNTIGIDRVKNPSAQAIIIADDDRYNGMPLGGGRTLSGIGPNTTDVEVVNNIIFSTNKGELLMAADNNNTSPPNTVVSQFFKEIDYNAYFRTSKNEQQYFWDGAFIKSTREFSAATGWDKNALDLSAGINPYFNNIPEGDYRVRTDSQAYLSGKPLPSDVANAIGLPADGKPVTRGAFFASYDNPTPPIVDNVKPTGPSKLSATPASTTQVNLSWPVANDLYGIREYKIFRNGNEISTVADTLSYKDTGLTANTTYKYQVKPVDNNGVIGDGSPEVSAKTNALVPVPSITFSGVSEGATVTSPIKVSVTTANVTNFVAVEFSVDGNLINTERGAPYCLAGDSGGVCRNYTISKGSHKISAKLIYDGTKSVTKEVSFTVGDLTSPTNPDPTGPTDPTPPPPPADTTPPSPPANLTRSLRTDWGSFRYVLDLKWTASQDNTGGTGIKEYQIRRNGQLIGKTGSNVTTYADNTISPDITYSYTVTAIDNASTPNASLPSATTAKATCFLIWCSLQ